MSSKSILLKIQRSCSVQLVVSLLSPLLSCMWVATHARCSQYVQQNFFKYISPSSVSGDSTTLPCYTRTYFLQTNSNCTTLLNNLLKSDNEWKRRQLLIINIIGWLLAIAMQLLGITIVNLLAISRLNRKLWVLKDFQLTKIAHYTSI